MASVHPFQPIPRIDMTTFVLKNETEMGRIMGSHRNHSWARSPLQAAVLLLCLGLTCGCSLRKYAINKIGDSLAAGGSVYESDDDLELVGDALPFSLKLIESLLIESPRHRGLLLTACKGFTLYSYAYVQNEAEVLAVSDLEGARKIRQRARRLYLRAHRYGVRGLETSYPGMGQELLIRPSVAVKVIQRKEDVPLIYWTAAALGLAISSSRHDASLLARIPEVEALLDRALELEEDWKQGSLHEFRIILAKATPGKINDEELHKSFERGLELSENKRASLYVAYAEAVAIPQQNPSQFRALIDKALSIDPNENESNRLANLVAQRRALWLIGRIDDLILPSETDGGGGEKP